MLGEILEPESRNRENLFSGGDPREWESLSRKTESGTAIIYGELNNGGKMA